MDRRTRALIGELQNELDTAAHPVGYTVESYRSRGRSGSSDIPFDVAVTWLEGDVRGLKSAVERLREKFLYIHEELAPYVEETGVKDALYDMAEQAERVLTLAGIHSRLPGTNEEYMEILSRGTRFMYPPHGESGSD